MIISLIRLTRPYYSVPVSCGLIVIVMYLTTGGPSPDWNHIALACLALCCTISAAYVLNDVFDVAVDMVNCPSRILTSGKVSIKIAVVLSTLLFLAGLSIAALCGRWFFGGILLITLLLLFYDAYSKRIGLWKDFLSAALMTSLYPLALTLVDAGSTPQTHSLYLSSIWLFLTCLSFQMYKDAHDAKGDTGFAPKGIAAYSSKKWFLCTARSIAVTASLLTLLIWGLGYCKTVFLVASVTAVALAIISTLQKPAIGIRFLYAEVAVVTAGALLDILIYS